MFSCEISHIFNNIFFYRTPPVAASGNWYTVYMITQKFLKEMSFYGVVGIMHEGAYFCGFIAFENLKY